MNINIIIKIDGINTLVTEKVKKKKEFPKCDAFFFKKNFKHIYIYICLYLSHFQGFCVKFGNYV